MDNFLLMGLNRLVAVFPGELNEMEDCNVIESNVEYSHYSESVMGGFSQLLR